MMQKIYRQRLLISVVLITILSWVEIQYLTEGFNASPVSERSRHIYHLLLLLTIAGIGYWGWGNHPKKWLKSLWLLSYSGVIILLTISAITYVIAGSFNNDIIGFIRVIRIFFCSPMPFFLIYVLSKIN
ncbi:MAG: hypothetical protein WCG87_08670 [Bacteroidota bacterium]